MFELNDLVNKYILCVMLRQRALFYGLISDVVLVPYHEKHIVAVPMVQKHIVAIPTVGNNNAIWFNLNLISRLVVGNLSIANIHKLRKKAVVIQQSVHLDRSLFSSIMRPVVDRQRQ